MARPQRYGEKIEVRPFLYDAGRIDAMPGESRADKVRELIHEAFIHREKVVQYLARDLAGSHVISYQNPKIKNDHNWAGYSPSNGLYWVNGENFKTAGEAARKMAEYGLENWLEFDKCIDE